MRSAPLSRFVALALLAAWGAGLAVTLAVGLHLATSHAHDELTAVKALALAHGHEHDLSVPTHEHEAARTELSTSVAPSYSAEHQVPRAAPLDGLAEGHPALALDRIRPHPPAAFAPPLRL